MAGKVSIKTTTAIFLLCTVVLAFYACIEPVNIKDFLGDDEVGKVIASTKETVKLGVGSPKELVGGNHIISGLATNRYYMIEKEIDKDGSTSVTPADYPKFVTDYTNGGGSLGPGGLTPLLRLITRIKDGKINNLTNLNTYTVRSAEKFPITTTFTYTGPSSINVDNDGVITIISPAGTISLENLNTDYNGYEVMAVPVSHATLDQTTSPFKNYTSKTIGTGVGGTVTSFQLEGVGTTVDYVFFKKDTPSSIFKVLTVKRQESTYDISLSTTEKPTLEETTYTFPDATVGETPPTLTVTVTNKGNQPTGNLILGLSGDNSSSFDLSKTLINSIGTTANANDTFTVFPKGGLTANTYNAIVTVSGSNGISKAFNIKFTVTSAKSDVKFTNITFTYDDEIDALIPTSSIGKLKRGNYDGAQNVVINFDTGGALWSDFKWMIDNTDVTSIVTSPTSNVRRLTINNNVNGDFGALLGTNSFTVSVSAVLGGKRYSKMITILVED
jgi:hypothetical protein